LGRFWLFFVLPPLPAIKKASQTAPTFQNRHRKRSLEGPSARAKLLALDQFHSTQK
jgi:hypothetical protein